jgi:hypothetical protein
VGCGFKMEPKVRVEKFMARAASENVFGGEVFLALSLLTALFYTYLCPPTSMIYAWPIQDLRDQSSQDSPNDCGFCHGVYKQSQREI